MAWVFLVGAIIFEVAATLALRMAAQGRKLWFFAVAVGYLAAFGFLTLTLANGMGLGVAYGIWAAAGVGLTAILSKLLFDEPFTWLMAAGIALVAGGVLMVEHGASH